MAAIEAPPSGVKVRMYRQGHGDCFLLTMRKDDGSPFHMLIDCGLWTNSEIEVTVEDVIDDIVDATNGHLDVLMVTHEHMDHVNMFSARLGGEWLWDRIEIEELWLGWTANSKDPYAKKIRKARDQAVRRLAAYANKIRLRNGSGMRKLSTEIDDLLAFEGIAPPAARFAASKGYKPKVTSTATMDSKTAAAMDYLFGRIADDAKITYFDPHAKPRPIPGVSGARVYALGPPRDEDRLDEDEPKAAQSDRLYDKEKHGFSLDLDFAAALEGILGLADIDPSSGIDPYRPFAREFEQTRKSGTARDRAFFRHFLPKNAADDRSIENAWLFSLAWFARKINVLINNTSLVLALELEQSGKVLLLAGDAQYGNWVTWADKALPGQGNTELSVRDLLARTVFYKTGHHGSHNATLKGQPDSDYANLSWLGQGDLADEFVAFIPANEPWADKVKDWKHPLKSIRTALMEKASGRVFQSDVAFSAMARQGGSASDWTRFKKNAKGSGGKLYFEYWIEDA